MTPAHHAQRIVPAPIAVAAGLLTTAVVGFVLVGVLTFVGGSVWGVLPLGLAAVGTLIVVGLRRGVRAAHIGAVVIGALAVTSSFTYTDDLRTALVTFLVRLVFGVLLLALLLVPASSRKYFQRA